MKNKIIAVVGPTASGKTALAIEIAKRFDGEIISCDSMQVYKHMDIGTAKPSESERRGVLHHMIDIAEPEQDYSCAEYAKAARECVLDISRRGKLPIFCGGTGLYLDAALNDKRHDMPGRNEKIREQLSALSIDELHRSLTKVDPVSAAAIHPNNVKRVIRALEIYMLTKIPKSEWDKRSMESGSTHDAVIIGLDFEDRDVLYHRINSRVDKMLADGLVDEVKSLAGRLGRTASQAIGYKEILAYLRGETALNEAVENLKRVTRNYAKRQLTWFRAIEETNWFFADKDLTDEIYMLIKA